MKKALACLSVLSFAFVAGGMNCQGTTSAPMPGNMLTGVAANGKVFFDSNNCATCHCADATGGCLPSAPSLVGVSFTLIDDHLRGAADHPGGKFPALTDQDLTDLEAYLASP